MAKQKIAVLFGGTNSEHEVSLVSAQAVINNLDKNKFDIIPIKITKENTWVTPKTIKGSYLPKLGKGTETLEKSLTTLKQTLSSQKIDVVFPVLHGPYGEDGTIQGLLELMHIPYVGCGVTASAVCMDKVIQKNICRDYGIPVTNFFWLSADHWQSKKEQVLKLIQDQLGAHYPLFVKPANQGSSVGITKAHNEKELIMGVDQALSRDTKVIIEQAVNNPRELECAILGANYDPQTSVIGEIIPDNEFYDYQAKYLSEGSQCIIPAKLDKDIAHKIISTARLAFEVLDCYGLARADFLLDQNTNEFYLSELNSMPGFTPISMYPKLWEASGVSYSDLLTRLIELAIKRNQIKSQLNYSV